MSDESDDPSDIPEDEAGDADQVDPSPDPDEGPSEQGDATDGGAEESDDSPADAAGDSVEREVGDAGEGESGEAEDRRAGPAGGESGGHGSDGSGGPGHDGNGDQGGADPERVKALAEELAATREQLADLESRVDEKTVHRADVMAELKRYVRARHRRGHATGWGPYLVLLYGTVMSLGAFYYLGGWPVIAALVVIWLSTLGLFVVMLLAGALVGAGRKLGGARDIIGMLRR
jgi:membrane protein